MSLVEPTPLFGAPMMILPDALAELAHGAGMSRFVGSRRGTRGEWLPYAVTDGGVAILTILGPLSNRAGWMGPSYEWIGYQLRVAKDDPQVCAVLLDIESPGGQAGGAFDAAAAVRAVAAEKPVVAVVNSMAASAAYAIASGATRIVTTPSGMAGSIGVVMLHASYARLLDKAGITPTLIHAGARKVDGNPYEELSDESRASLQHDIDALYDQFVDTVATGRKNLTSAAIRATEARIYVGAEAVSAGIADEVGTFDSALAALTLSASAARGSGGRARAEAETTTAEANTTTSSDGSQSTMTEITQADLDRARSEAKAAETARVSGILGLPEAKGRESLAQQLAMTDGLTVDAAKVILAAAPKTSSLEERAGSVPHLGGGADTGAAPEKQAAIDKGWDDIVASENARRGLTVPRRAA